MRDDSHRWDPPRAPDAPIDLGPAVLRPVRLARQLLVSGPGIRAGAGAPLVEWPGDAPAGPCALGLRRDRVLMIDGPEMAEGWDSARAIAISDMSDGYAVFNLSGPGALDLLRRGAAIDPRQPSASVVRLLFGIEVFLYRMQDGPRFRLHVARARAETLVKSFETAARLAQMSKNTVSPSP